MSLRHWLAGLALYLLFMMLFAPAGLLVWMVNSFSDGQVQMTGVTGRFWNGEAGRVLVRIPGELPVELTGVGWQLQPARLLWGAAPLRVENTGGLLALSAQVAPNTDGVCLGRLRLNTRLENLVPYIAMREVASMQGDLHLESESICLGRKYAGKVQGELNVTAGNLPLGSYELVFTGAGPKLNLQWKGPLGPSAMSGGGWWDGALHMDGLPGAITR